MLPTLIRGRLWKVCFLGPNPTCPGFLVIPKGSEEDFQVPTLGNPQDSMEYSKQVAVASKWVSRNDS